MRESFTANNEMQTVFTALLKSPLECGGEQFCMCFVSALYTCEEVQGAYDYLLKAAALMVVRE